MAEHINHPSRHEKHIDRSERPVPDLEHKQPKKTSERKTSTPEHIQSIEAIQRSIESEAISSKDTNITERETAIHPNTHRLTKQIKEDGYKKTLRRTQNQLSGSEKTFSKIIHQHVVDAVSTVAANTVARSSGILGGGVIALLGTLAFYLISRHYGFYYNFFTFILLFIIGYTGGMLLELIISKIRSRSR